MLHKWRNQGWNLCPLYKIMLPTCHQWAPWLSQEKDNLRTDTRKARILAPLKPPGLLEDRTRKGLALALHIPLFPTQVAHSHPSVPTPSQGRGNRKPQTLQGSSRCSGRDAAEDNRAFLQAGHRLLGGREGRTGWGRDRAQPTQGHQPLRGALQVG